MKSKLIIKDLGLEQKHHPYPGQMIKECIFIKFQEVFKSFYDIIQTNTLSLKVATHWNFTLSASPCLLNSQRYDVCRAVTDMVS